MRDLSLVLLLSGATLLSAERTVAQDSLSVRDASEIRYKAERMVKTELNELFNALSNANYESHEVAESIHSAYTESRNRIFRDSLVQVEPDINPAIRGSGQSGDEPVGKYLRDIDLLYKKSDAPTVEFDHVRCSAVKKNENIYVKVYYSSHFKGHSAISDQPYGITNRLAEINAVRDRNQWRLYIVRLAFYNPADTVGDVAHNMPIRHEARVLAGLTGRSTAQDSAQALRRLQSVDEQQSAKITEQLQEQESMDDERFRRMLALGDSAFRAKDYTVALKYFKDAQDLRPNSPDVSVRIKNAGNAINDVKLQSAQLYAGYIEKARLLENSRQYKEAIESYQNAIQQKPEEATNLQPHIRQLTDRFSTVSDLQEKFNAGFIREALKQYSEAIKRDPNNSDYYLGRGRCHEKLTDESKNLVLAMKDYTQAYELDHNNLLAIKYRGELYERTGDYFKALSDYKVYLTIDRSNIPMYEKMSAMHIQLRLYNEALGDLDQALAIDPRAAHVYLSKGILLLLYNRQHGLQQDIKSARENFTTCLRIDSSNAQAFFNRGRCNILLSQPTDAAADFAAAREKGLDTSSNRMISGYAAGFYNEALARAAKKDMDSALRYIDVAIAFEPASVIYHFTRGEFCYSIGDSRSAIASYDLATHYNSAYIPAIWKRGMARYALDDYQGAMSDFDAALRLDPRNPFAARGRGDALRAQKDYIQAKTAYENAIHIATTTKEPAGPDLLAQLYNSLGFCYTQTGEWDKAVEAEKKAISIDRNLAEAYFNRGFAYYREGKLQDAIDDLTKAISQLDRHPEWRYVLGRVYLDKKMYPSAAGEFAAYLEKDKALALPDAVYQEGYCRYMMQDYAGALRYYDLSAKMGLDSAYKSLPLEMGVSFLNTGKFDSAYHSYRLAWQRDSTNGWAAYGVGASLALQGKTDESIAWFERSFRMKTPSYAEIKRDRLLDNFRNTNRKFKDLLKKYY